VNNNIIFINGLSIPKILAKTKYVWDDKLWKNYNRAYLSSPVSISDLDAKNQLTELINIVNSVDSPIVIGQSLGAWWAANLACVKDINLNKLILFTPLADARLAPMCNVTKIMNPLEQPPYLTGPHKVLVCEAKYDMVCPIYEHSYPLIRHFNAMPYSLNGGHFFQKDHTACLSFIQDWIDLQ
jgi:hypothetical protein